MNDKYKKLMEEGLDSVRQDDSTHGCYKDGFTACYEEMQKAYQALERKLEVAKKALTIYSALNANQLYEPGHQGSIARQALAEIKGE